MSARPITVALEVGLNADAPRGIDYYMANVVEALAEMDERNNYVVFSYFFKDYERKRARLPAPETGNFESVIRRFPERLVRLVDRRWGLPLVQRGLLRRPVDVYHVLGGGSLPHVSGMKTVVTFFDAASEAFPADGSKPEPGKKISDPYTYEIARRADCLLATGEYTKKDLMRYYGVPEAKIAVISTGVNTKVFRPIRDEKRLRAVAARYRLPGAFVMMIGPFDPPRRTNAETMLRAFAGLRREGAVGDCRLVLVGRGAAHLAKLDALASELGIADLLVKPGYVELEDLPVIYQLSRAVVHPTSIEGFGFGMEVLACGVPFITSDLPGVVEAVSDAALTVPPGQVEPLARAVRDLLGDPELRRRLSEKGLARAAGFSYRGVATRLIGLYEGLAAEAA